VPQAQLLGDFIPGFLAVSLSMDPAARARTPVQFYSVYGECEAVGLHIQGGPKKLYLTRFM